MVNKSIKAKMESDEYSLKKVAHIENETLKHIVQYKLLLFKLVDIGFQHIPTNQQFDVIKWTFKYE